jgi:hypothetical protein
MQSRKSTVSEKKCHPLWKSYKIYLNILVYKKPGSFDTITPPADDSKWEK